MSTKCDLEARFFFDAEKEKKKVVGGGRERMREMPVVFLTTNEGTCTD